MCGASKQQKDIEASQAEFYKTLTENYKTQFAESDAILKSLTSQFDPILKAGIGQEGFTAPEKAALNTQASEGVATNYANAAKSVNEQIAGAGGGNAFLPSGAGDALKYTVATSAAKQQSDEQNQIIENNYATGRQNFLQAASVLGGSTGVFNPSTGAGQAANQGGSDAATTANEISQANNSWMGPVLGAVGALGGAAIPKIPCWIAEAIYGVNDIRTHTVRAYLNGTFKQSFYGRFIMNMYVKHGEAVAVKVRKSWLLKLAFRPLFELALWGAK